MIKKFLIVMSFLAICTGASFANTDEKKICTGFGTWTEGWRI